jgi:hypothetical protein
MSLVQRLLAKIRKPAPILIETAWGPVTESARRQAAINMREDANLRLRVENLVIKECGGDILKGQAECRRRYPEAYR